MSIKSHQNMNISEGKSKKPSKIALKLNSMPSEENNVSFIPKKIRCISFSKNKRRKQGSNLFNAAHQIKENETFFSPNGKQGRYSCRCFGKDASLKQTYFSERKHKGKLRVQNQFSISIEGQTSLSMLIQGFQQPNELTSIPQKQNDENSHHLINKSSRNSMISLLYTLRQSSNNKDK